MKYFEWNTTEFSVAHDIKEKVKLTIGDVSVMVSVQNWKIKE